jgi:hypothetical protein
LAIFDPNEKPDENLWDRQSEYLAEIWHDPLEAMAVADSMYFQTNNIWSEWEAMAPGRRKGRRPNLHSGRARALIDQAVNSHLPITPSWSRIPVHDTTESKSKADRLENGFRIVFSDAMTQSHILSSRVNGKQLILHNYTQLGVFLDESNLRKPVKRKGEKTEDFEQREWEWSSKHNTYNPLKLVVPEPGEVLMNPFDKHPDIAIRKRKMKAFELTDFTTARGERADNDNRGQFRGAFAKVFGMGAKDAYEDVEVEEWWSSRWYGLRTMEGEVLVMEPNLRGIQPFTQCWGGSPIMPTGAEWNLSWWVKQSLIFQEKDTLVMLDQANVAHHQLLQRAAWARRGTSGDPAEVASQDDDDWLSGEKNDVWLEDTPSLPGQSFQHKAELMDSVERNTYSSMNSGFRQPGVDTATGILVLSEAGHRLFADAKLQLQGMFSVTGANSLRLLWKVAKEYGPEFASIDRGEYTLRVADMENRFHIEAQFNQVDAVVALQERADARIDLEAGRIDEDTFFRVARYEDVEGIRRRRFGDIVNKDPDIIEQGVIAAMRAKGFSQVAERRQAELDKRELQRTLVDESGAPLSGANGQNLVAPGAPSGQNLAMPGVPNAATEPIL